MPGPRGNRELERYRGRCFRSRFDVACNPVDDDISHFLRFMFDCFIIYRMCALAPRAHRIPTMKFTCRQYGQLVSHRREKNNVVRSSHRNRCYRDAVRSSAYQSDGLAQFHALLFCIMRIHHRTVFSIALAARRGTWRTLLGDTRRANSKESTIARQHTESQACRMINARSAGTSVRSSDIFCTPASEGNERHVYRFGRALCNRGDVGASERTVRVALPR